MAKYLITSALPYSNGELHVGHIAGAYLPADTYVRYRRSRGDDVRFICGSDDNGAAIELAAIKQKSTPAEIVAKFHALQEEAFKGLGISFDVYGGTHSPGFDERHTQISQDFFKAIYDKGLFRKVTSRQFFDPQAGGKGKFLPDRYITGTCPKCGYEKANGSECENCQAPFDVLELKNPKSVLTGNTPIIKETTHWHLRLDQFEKPLKEWLESKTDWRPFVLNKVLSDIKNGLPERAMTRDLDWGIPVPLDDPDAAGKVLFVWFDAPIGYVSFTAQLLENQGKDWQSYVDWWKNPDCKIYHFIGEDNIIFHALIWPAVLMAEGTFRLPEQVVANSFLNIIFEGKEVKSSKSAGTAVWIREFLEKYDADALRYYLTAIAPESARTAYDWDDFLNRNDGELVAVPGNLINRTVTFAIKNYDGKVPQWSHPTELDRGVLTQRDELLAKIAEQYEGFKFRQALTEVLNLARLGNQYLDATKPWVQRKTDSALAGSSIYVCLQIVRSLVVAMQPILPGIARKTLTMLNLDESALAWDRATEELPGGHVLGEAQILVKKLKEEPKR